MNIEALFSDKKMFKFGLVELFTIEKADFKAEVNTGAVTLIPKLQKIFGIVRISGINRRIRKS